MNPKEHKIALDKFHRSKTVHSILIHIATDKKIGKKTSVAELYDKVVFPLNRVYKNNALHAFQEWIKTPDKKVFQSLTIDEDIKEELFVEIKKRLAPKPVPIRADFDIQCFSYSGISAIKKALLAG